MTQAPTIKSFSKQSFTLLDDSKSKWFLIIFSGVFATFFIYFFNPFGIKEIRYQAAIGNFLSILTVGFWGAITLIITQFGIRLIAGLKTFSLGQFLIWVCFELIFLSLISFLIFGELDKPIIKEFGVVMRYTLSLAILPYFLACLLIAVFKLSIRSKEQEATIEQSSQPLVIKESNGKVSLTLLPEDLLYLKSEGNYTQVVYLDHEQESKKLIRNNLKTLESDLETPDLIRIHRSYVINRSNINQVTRLKGSFKVQLKGIPELWLKVSDTYKKEFKHIVE